jgi:predicted ATPase
LEETLVERLAYLGPVCSDPRPFYPVEETSDIGLRGEATVPCLLRHQNDFVQYALSPTQSIRQASLLGAINDWLLRMGITTQPTIEPVESIAYVAAIQSPSASAKSVNLAQVGFGISQLLPVLVMGLKNPADGWLLLEQPEIHLHPRLQGELAEFLLCAARAGKTIIVETHSDHLINRLRRCVAEDETGTLSELVSILFVHPGTSDNPSSYVEPLEIDGSGSIVNWPPDFLSDSANEALAIMRAAPRKAQTVKT